MREMISSRCLDRIGTTDGKSVDLSDLRIRTKHVIEALQLFERDTFECWVHEDEPTMDGNADIWDHCLDAVRHCDILLVLFNGNAGFGKTKEQVGMCHAELAEALRTSAAKIRVIDIQKATVGELSESKERNRRFAEYMERQELPKRFATNDDEALRFLLDAQQDAVAAMVHLGVSNNRGWDTGAPLDWSHLDYAQRKKAMESVLLASLQSEGAEKADSACVFQVESHPIYFCCHAVPAAMTVAFPRGRWWAVPSSGIMNWP
jgi:hypothetical protein